jgi:hypothetical protein
MKHFDAKPRCDSQGVSNRGKCADCDRPRFPYTAPLKQRLADWRKRWSR